ncbi:hypothetical protein [Paraburkholderia youngii]|uniref:hypothetical protein n=1 Tax=Paraburkholderia youngii TaxID=2782701 RepID=UPI003D1CA708
MPETWRGKILWTEQERPRQLQCRCVAELRVHFAELYDERHDADIPAVSAMRLATAERFDDYAGTQVRVVPPEQTDNYQICTTFKTGRLTVAIDPASERLFSVCANHRTMIVDATSGRRVAEVLIGGPP